MSKNVLRFVVLFSLFCLVLFSGCAPVKEPLHQDIFNDSPKLVSFKYVINYVPIVGEPTYFPFAIVLLNNTYYGDDASITFKSGENYKANENPINFQFQDQEMLLGIRLVALNISKPIFLEYVLEIKNKNNPQTIKGSLKINR